MRPDYENIKSTFISIKSQLNDISKKIEDNLIEYFRETEHIDRITCRVKAEKSFLTKIEKLDKNGVIKYKEPFKEVQDIIGARIIVYYKTDVEVIASKVKELYHQIEINKFTPEDVSKFGYEGQHIICSIPNIFYPQDSEVPDFFELQIKTLYQHAWSQAGHGLGYKPESTPSEDDQRKLAFIAAQSWGADKILVELLN